MGEGENSLELDPRIPRNWVLYYGFFPPFSVQRFKYFGSDKQLHYFEELKTGLTVVKTTSEIQGPYFDFGSFRPLVFNGKGESEHSFFRSPHLWLWRT